MNKLENLTRKVKRNDRLSTNGLKFAITQGNRLNERITEDIIYDILKENEKKYSGITIEKQKSENKIIDKLLKHASKQGNGIGKPEFIITFKDLPDLVIVIECKADIKKHESKNRDCPKDFAVDGVLLYSEYLAKEFDVISIAVSGQTKAGLKISTFLQLKSKKPIDKSDKTILTFEDYITLYKKDPEKEKISIDSLIQYSRELNNYLRDDFELEEGQRPLLVSGILIALEDKAFESSYMKERKAIDLAESLTNTIEKILRQHNVEQKKKEDMVNVYSFIKTNNNIAQDLNNQRNTKLRDLIFEINNKVRGFTKDYAFHDILGQFYGEFLRYANGDRGLGIVLTPKHITELFVELAKVNKNSVVLDNCCGTGGFLIASMKKMINDAGNDSKKIANIYNNQLIGIDNNSKMFCLACSNMLLRGDGKSNIFHNTCFEIDEKEITKLKPTVGFLNPPYAKKKKGFEELNYILNCLKFLEKNGICIAIVPLSCAINQSKLKEIILENHTLKAVMSMPDELFSPLGTYPCIMVFEAHVPHDEKEETFFGYWKDDGFVKTKHDGRIDKNDKWNTVKNQWLDQYKNKRSITGKSIMQKVTADVEWCAEAYMETDYSNITKEDFVKEIQNYVIFKTRNGD